MMECKISKTRSGWTVRPNTVCWPGVMLNAFYDCQRRSMLTGCGTWPQDT